MSKIKFDYIKPKLTHIDCDEFKKLADVFVSDVWKIPNNSYLDTDIVNLLYEYNSKGIDIKKLFAKDESSSEYAYTINITCYNCGSSVDKAFTKTALCKYIKNDMKCLCPNCKQAYDISQKQQKEIEQEARLQEYKELLEQNTDDYIELYLNPNNSWNKNISTRDRYYEIAKSNVILEDIETTIKGMVYYDFLSTPYWKAVSAEKKRQTGYRCQLCGDNHKLVVHHRTYENHGKEHTYQVMKTDLIVLCDDCHKKFHNIGEDNYDI